MFELAEYQMIEQIYQGKPSQNALPTERRSHIKFYRMIILLCLITAYVNSVLAQVDIGLIEDRAPQNVNGKFRKGSHIKLFKFPW